MAPHRLANLNVVKSWNEMLTSVSNIEQFQLQKPQLNRENPNITHVESNMFKIYYKYYIRMHQKQKK